MASPPHSIDPTVAGICEVTLETRDTARLERFYTRVFGLTVLAREQERVWLASGARARLGLWAPGAKEFGDRGGRHVHYVEDPEGNVVELWDFFERGRGVEALA